jgi:hypothetical protein
MKSLKPKSWDSLKRLGERLRRPHADRPRQPRRDMVDRLLGEMTHFCFVVELDEKGRRERSRSL